MMLIGVVDEDARRRTDTRFVRRRVGQVDALSGVVCRPYRTFQHSRDKCSGRIIRLRINTLFPDREHFLFCPLC